MNKEKEKTENRKIAPVSYLSTGLKISSKSRNKLKASRGFTLIETLIAIAILVLAILGPLTIASNSLNTAYYARDQVTAFYLAQEGVEYIREQRDNNSINSSVTNGGKWDSGFTDICLDALCGLDPYQSGSLFACASVGSCPVKYDPLTGLYRQQNDSNGFTSTNFKRTITIKRVTDDEDQVTVLVAWTTGNLNSPNTFKITEDLFNWQQGVGRTVEPGDGGGGGTL